MRKQLVIQLARFGDIIQTKRLILSLRLDGEVHLCVDQSLQDLARLIYPDVPLFSLPGPGSNPAAVLPEAARTLETLRRERYDDVYILNHAGLSRALGCLFEPERVRGYIMNKGQSLKSNWMRMAFRWMRRRDAAPLNLVDFWAGLAPEPCAPASVNPVAAPGGRGIGVVLAGRNARRSLPAAMLVPVIRAVFERLDGAPVFLLGGKAERPAAREILSLLPARVGGKTSNLAGKTGWRGLADAVAGLDTLLSPDTGTIHLAAHLGVPTEGLFLSSAWAFETGPYGEGHRVWQALAGCSPCMESSACLFDVRCRGVFADPAFLARLRGRGKTDSAPPGLLALRSGFDGMGLTWNAEVGNDPWARSRREVRGVLGEYLGIPAPAPLPLPAESDPAQTLYQEADWMLPRILP